MTEEILVKVLGTTLNKDPDELTGLLFEDGEPKDGTPTKVLKKDAENVSLTLLNSWYSTRENEWKAKTKAVANDKHGQGMKEAAEKFEKIVSELTGYTSSDLKGEDFIREALSNAQKPKKDYDFKTDPNFLKFEAEKKRQMEQQLAELTNRFESEKKSWQREETFKKVSDRIRVKLETMNPVLPTNPEARLNQLNIFSELFKGYEFQDNQNGGFNIFKDGERLEELGSPVDFDKFVESKARSFFDFAASDPKKGTGQGGGNGGGGSIQIAKTQSEYLQMMASEKDPQKRIAIKKAHEGKGIF